MPSLIDLTSNIFGQWVVIGRSLSNNYRCALWLCRCSCGIEREVRSDHLRSGASTGCGCIKRGRPLTHGATINGKSSRTYHAWSDMIQRVRKHPHYAGRIQICEKWRKFAGFLEDMGECPQGLTLDRIDGTKNYEPGNCRWATWLEQAQNKVRPKEHEVKGHRRAGHQRGKSYVSGSWIPTFTRGGK